MAVARIIDETGRKGPWIDPLKEALGAAGFGLTGSDNGDASLTVLLFAGDAAADEERFDGDLLVLKVPSAGGGDTGDEARTEVIGSSRLKARHRLTDASEDAEIAEEIRPLVNLFTD